ncbi:MAG TPA: Gfo/Idh/MocA family oxidoreductase, partial [Anaerolineaceae bacterium]|nr:Gfo/Idh/MocA family oxidoreductase [Anaerolineaceae bacterium]
MRFLIAGFGSIGRRHFRNLLTLGYKDIILLRSNKSTLDTSELDGYIVETNIDAALAHEPDAVIISNPTALHLDVAIPAANQGCHLFFEKPISDSMDRIPELKDALRIGGGKAMTGFQYRFHPGLIQVKKWI